MKVKSLSLLFNSTVWLIVLSGCVQQAWAAPSTTTTTLAVTSTGTPVTSVASGSVLTLTATVQSGGTAMTIGTVNFCDATATFCTDIHLFGTSQITSAGTAAIKLRPGIGSHSYKAVFVGTTSKAASISGTAAVAVTGLYPTTTTIAQSSSVGNYTLTATVGGVGPMAPTGTASFIDTSNGNVVLGTAGLGVGTAAGLSLINSSNPQTGNSPQSIAVGDFNGDGIPDLAVVGISNSVTVLLGNGNGTFTPTATSPQVTSGQWNIVVGDFNGDGIQDLAVGDGTILLGNGDGTFKTAPRVPAGGSFAVGDFNGDGILDLVGAKGTVLLGNGDGTFRTALSIPASGSAIVVGDFNGDGKLDLALTNPSGSSLSVLLGNGDGTFTAAASPATGWDPIALAMADFNNDGILDLAVSNDDGTVTILLGKGDGTFTPVANPSTGLNLEVAVGDFNGDGIPDLAVINDITNAVTLLLGKGDGTFTQAPIPAAATGSVLAVFIAVGDFNGDGKADLAVSSNTNTVKVLLAETQSAAATISGVAPAGVGMHQVEASYLGDNSYDPSTSGTTALSGTAYISLTLLRNPAAYGTWATFTATVRRTFAEGVPTGTVTFMNGTTLLGTAPLDSNGVATYSTKSLPVGQDIISASYGGDNTYASANSEGLVESVTPVSVPPTATTALAVTSAGNLVTTVTSGSVVTLTATVKFNGAPATPGTVNFCDATATNCMDIHLLGTAQLTSAGAATIKLRPGVGSHSYKAVFVGTASQGASSSGTATLAVTGIYPTTTIIAQSGSVGNYTLTATVGGVGPIAPTGTVSFLDTSNGNAVLGTAGLGAGTAGLSFLNTSYSVTGWHPSTIAVGDFNGDGIPDLAVASDENSNLTIMLGNGDGTFRTASLPVGLNPTSIAVGDFNGDGIPDLAVGGTGSKVAVLLGKGDGTFSATASLAAGSYQSSIAVGDFNGDGILDLAVANEYSPNSVTILLGNGDGTFTPAPSLPVAGCAIVAGDFDRDGKTDLAVSDCNQQNATTVFLGNGDGTFTALPSVATGAYSIAISDFNGDGILDMAVPGSGGVSVLLGKGDGTFTSAPSLGTMAFFCSIAVGDVNGDGVPDLAEICDKTTTATIYIGKGDGTFTQSVNPPLNLPPEPDSPVIAVGDFTGDGRADLAVTSTFADTVTVLLAATQTTTATATGVAPAGVGLHLSEASYLGDTNNHSSTSGTTGLQGTAFVGLTAYPNPAAFGATVTFTARVRRTFAEGTPTGTVTFMNGTTSLGTNPLDSNGVATYSTNLLPVGQDIITALYGGNTTYSSATSGGVIETVNADAITTLSVTSAGNLVTAVTSGIMVTLTATVQFNGAPATAGSVNFCDATAAYCTDIHLLGTAQLTSAGTASIKLRPGVGSHSYKAVYGGTNSIGSSASSVSKLGVTGIYPTTTTIAQSGSVGNYTLTATVGGVGPMAPTGTVSFLDTSNGNSVLGTAGLIAGAPGLSFVTPWSGSTSWNPYSIAVADFNRDGIPDIVVGDGSVSLGNGDGTLSTAPTLQAGGAMAIGDFNGDGIPDLVMGGTVFLSNGDGTFKTLQSVPGIATTNNGAEDNVAVGDFNGDGILDIATASGTVLLGNGDGTFRVAPSLPNPGCGITSGDFNRDGKLDLVVTNCGYGPNSNTATTLLGNGDGTFTVGASSTTNYGSGPIVAADFNGDGILDLAVGSVYNNGIGLSVLLGNGDGTFTSVSAPNIDFVESIVVGDFNGDGIPDLAVTTAGSNAVTVFLGKGDGTFTNAANPATGIWSNAPGYVAVGDFNGDGKSDLATVGLDSKVLTVLLAQTAQTAMAAIGNISPVGSGTHQVGANYPGDISYNSSTSGTTGLIALPSTPVITWATPAAIRYGTALSTTQLNASSTVAGTFVYSPATGSVLTAGTQTLSVTFTPTDATDYTTATSTVQLTVNQATPSITFTVPNHTYGDAAFTVSATSSSSGAITYSVVSGPATISGSTVTLTGAGTVVLQASQTASGNYAAGTQPATFTVAGNAPTISFTVPNHTYGDAPFTVSATSNSSGAITYSVVSGPATISGSTVTLTGAGMVVLQASQAASSNYTSGTQTTTVTVDKESQTITFPAPTSPVTYGVSPITLVATGGASGNAVTFSVVSGPATVSGNTLAITGFGTVIVAANQAGNTNYSAAAQVTQSIVVVAANLNFNVTGLAFGSEPLGATSSAQTLIITNPNGSAVTITGIVTSGDFSATSNCPTIAAFGTCSVNVTFTPSISGARTGTLTLTDAQSNNPQSAQLTGTGTAPGIQITPASLNFGSQVIATASYGQTINIQNTGTANLVISNITTTGDFTTTGSCASVPAGSNCSLTVTFTPIATGARTGIVTLTDNVGSGNQSQLINLSGVGTQAGATLTPSVQTFPSTLVTSTSFVQNATLTNTGTASLTGIAVSILGDFTQTSTCPISPATLAPNATCTVSVIYAPTVAGAESGSLIVTDSLGTQTVSLLGTGLVPGASLSSGQLVFGGQLVNTSSLAQTVIFTNTGTAAVNITSVVLTTNFTDTTNCSGSIAAGASCSINVVFTPKTTGSLSGTVTITDSAGTQVVAVQGQGISLGLSVAPSFEIFGAQVVGTISQAQTLTVTNTGTTSLILNPITVSNNFNESDQCSSITLLAGASCSISLSFSPTATGNISGSLVISDTNGLVSTMATVSGQGTLPGISTSPSTISFGSLSVGTTSQAQTVTVSNTGSAPLMIGTVSGTGDFAETDTCSGQTIAAGSYCVISVTMTPTTTGMRTGTIRFNDNADGMDQIALSGMGQQAGVSISPTSLAFGSLPIVSASQVSTATGTSLSVQIINTGNGALTLGGFSTQGDFTESNSCDSTVVAGATCTVTIKFVPTALGHRTGTLTIADNAGGGTQLVSLQGDGSPAGLILSPPVLNFGAQSVGITSNTQTATLTNNTGASITNLAITPSGEYGESDNCNGTLANGASCTLSITVTPATSGAVTGTVTISAGGTIVTSAHLDRSRTLAVGDASNSRDSHSNDSNSSGPSSSLGVVAVSADTNSNSSATASQLAFSTAPAATVSAGGNAGSAITVLEEDNNGNSVSATDTISLAVSDANGYFKSYTATASDGVATFNLSNYALTVSGSYTYTATVASNTSIKSAAASETVTVNKATPVITWATPTAITYGTALSTTQLNASSTVAGTFVYSPTTGTVLTSGSQTLSVTMTPTDSTDYTTATSTVQLTVNQATPGITFTVPNHTYGDAPFTVAATSNSSGAITYSVVSGPVTISGSTVTLTGAGSVVLQASQVAAGNYTAGTQTAAVTVAKESQSITFSAPASPVNYGVAPITLSASASSGLAVAFNVVSGPGTISGSTLTITGAGTVVVAANQAGNTNYAAATQVTQSIVVNQASQTISFTAPTSPVTYGVSPITLSATSTSGLAVTFSVASGPAIVSGSTLTITGVGTVVVAANQTGNTNYSAATQETQSIVVNVIGVVATPTFSPVAGTYTAAQTVSISDTTASATIYYTTNGTTPTTSSPVYSGAITVSSTETLEAIATATGYSTSAVATAAYTISIPTNPVPAISGISPAFTNAGGAVFTLTINGSGFIANSMVYWGASVLTTTYVSATQLTAQVPAADIASAGTVAITVQTPAPGGGTSNVWQFEVNSVSSGSTAPTITSTTETVAAGSTASYPVTVPSAVTSVSVTCLNLPVGASCSYSSATNTVTIATSSTTPKGTYQITVVFTETVTGAAFLVPILLLPLGFMRRKRAARGIWLTACLGLVLMATAALSIGCGGGSSGGSGSTTPPATHQVTSSGAVSLTVQ